MRQSYKMHRLRSRLHKQLRNQFRLNLPLRQLHNSNQLKLYLPLRQSYSNSQSPLNHYLSHRHRQYRHRQSRQPHNRPLHNQNHRQVHISNLTLFNHTHNSNQTLLSYSYKLHLSSDCSSKTH
jgi:hypothetical protein